MSGIVNDIDNQAVKQNLQRMVRSSEHQTKYCLEFDFVSRAMKASGVSDGDTVEWIREGLLRYVDQQKQFWSAVAEIRDNGTTFQIDGTRTGLLICSDNPQCSRASRLQGMQHSVCITVGSKGVVIIPNAHDMLDMKTVWALIRAMECPVEMSRNASFQDLSRPGVHPLVPHWNMSEKNSSAICGVSIAATRLNQSVLINVVKAGLNPQGQRWFNRITDNSPTAQARRVAFAKDNSGDGLGILETAFSK